MQKICGGEPLMGRLKTGVLGSCFIALNLFSHAVFAESAVVIPSEAQAIANKFSSMNGATRMMCAPLLRCSLSLTTQFYTARNYQPVWNRNGKLIPEANQVINLLRHSYQDGLNPFDYHVRELRQMEQQIMTAESANSVVPLSLLADFDVTLSDAYLLYSKQMEFGRVDNSVAYPKWQVSKRSANVLALYQTAVSNNSLLQNLTKLTPSYHGYTQLKAMLAKYQQIAASGGWQTIPAGGALKKGSQGKRVSILADRVAATEDYSVPETGAIFDNNLQDGVKQFQSENGLKATGVVDSLTLQSLNIPVEQRIKQIQFNLDRMRWLPNELGNPYLIVNIPNYSLSIIQDGKLELTMPVIVGGGGDNKTCITNSQISMLELNPYWGIPFRIATKEYLHKIQESPTYLEAHQIRVYRNSDNQEVDPASIDWKNVTAKNFNYFLRQDPGKKNALGKIKFMFPNDCGIYLHDTSNPNLFSKKLRSLSHGCVRVSEPTVLANYLIEGNSNWNASKLESAIKTGNHKWVKIADPLAIHTVYWTTWVDNQNHLQFRKDIYKTESADFPVFIPKTVS